MNKLPDSFYISALKVTKLFAKHGF